MFDFVHEKKRLVQVVLALIILPFALWGVDSYRNSGGPAALAEVNGERISQQEFDRALEQQRQRMREMAGADFDLAMLDRPEIRQSILDGLVVQRVLAGEAKDAGLMPGDEQLAQVIAGIDAFHQDGKFDLQRYEAALNERGLNRLEFEERLRQDLAVRLLTDTYAQNGFTSQSVAERLIQINEQQRVVAVYGINPDEFVKQVRISDAEVKAYYDNNASEFQLPERANVEYVTFSAAALQQTITVSDEEIRQYYQEHAAEFGTQEQRQAAHILILADKAASAAQRQAAKGKAEQLLQQIKQAPSKFADLARQHSQDPGSAANGGDLGMFGRGMMVKPFEDSVFSLKAGEVSGVVESDFGYHIIKLLAVKPAKLQPLTEVRSMIVQRLKSQHAADRFAELAEQFSNTVYEQSDTLKPAAELVGASVQRAGWIGKGQVPSDLFTPKVLQAVFAEDAVKNKRNTAAIETGENSLLAARVVEYQPATLKPMAEVAAGIRQKLQRQQASELASKQGGELLQRLQRGDKVSLGWKPAQSVTRNQRSSLEPQVMQAVFRADTSKLPAYVGVTGMMGGYTVARIEAVKDVASIDELKLQRYAQQVAQMTGEELLSAFLADAKQRADITLKDSTVGNKE